MNVLHPRNYISFKGFTLIEILVALAIMALTAVIAIPTIQGIFGENLKTSSRKLAGAIKYIYNQSILKNKTMRLVYDLENQKYWAEIVSGEFLMVEEGEKTFFDNFNDEEENDNKFVKVENKLVEPRELASGVKFLSICSALKGDLIKEGKAYTHFFPNGVVENTMIHLAYKKRVFTLEIEPMLGMAKIYDQQEETTCNE